MWETEAEGKIKLFLYDLQPTDKDPREAECKVPPGSSQLSSCSCLTGGKTALTGQWPGLQCPESLLEYVKVLLDASLSPYLPLLPGIESVPLTTPVHGSCPWAFIKPPLHT